jgi:hypothetical protein
MRIRSSTPVRPLALACALALAAIPSPVLACATCFGKSDDLMAQGMNAGIFTLLLCILSVLAAIVVFFVYILRRAARLAAQNPPVSVPTHS